MARAKLSLNAHTIVRDAVENGVTYGWHRAFKYVEHGDIPAEEDATAAIAEAVMVALADVIDWDKSGVAK